MYSKLGLMRSNSCKCDLAVTRVSSAGLSNAYICQNFNAPLSIPIFLSLESDRFGVVYTYMSWLINIEFLILLLGCFAGMIFIHCHNSQMRLCSIYVNFVGKTQQIQNIGNSITFIKTNRHLWVISCLSLGDISFGKTFCFNQCVIYLIGLCSMYKYIYIYIYIYNIYIYTFI